MPRENEMLLSPRYDGRKIHTALQGFLPPQKSVPYTSVLIYFATLYQWIQRSIT